MLFRTDQIGLAIEEIDEDKVTFYRGISFHASGASPASWRNFQRPAQKWSGDKNWAAALPNLRWRMAASMSWIARAKCCPRERKCREKQAFREKNAFFALTLPTYGHWPALGRLRGAFRLEIIKENA